MSILDAYTAPTQAFDAKAAGQALAGISVIRPSKLQGPLTFRVLPAHKDWPVNPVEGASGIWRTGPFVGHHCPAGSKRA